MKIIDSDDYAASGIETLFFPGGEPHVKIPIFTEELRLFLKLRTWNDVGIAACLLSALESQDVDAEVFIPYFPGARQDRTDGTAPLTVEMIAGLLDYGRNLTVFDPHSDVLIDTVSPLILMPRHLELKNRLMVGVIAPDSGALFRAEDYLEKFHPDAELIQCTKERDPNTGRLSNYVVPRLEKRGSYIIVDDICDGGGTFNLLADAFFKDPIGKNCDLKMFVSHGIFSKGLDAIDPRIWHITTTDSWCKESVYPRLTVVPLLNAWLNQKDI